MLRGIRVTISQEKVDEELQSMGYFCKLERKMSPMTTCMMSTPPMNIKRHRSGSWKSRSFKKKRSRLELLSTSQQIIFTGEVVRKLENEFSELNM